MIQWQGLAQSDVQMHEEAQLEQEEPVDEDFKIRLELQRAFTPMTIDGATSSQHISMQQGSDGSEPPQSLCATHSSVEDAVEWEIRQSDLQICHHPDGRRIELGSGAFGKVTIGFWSRSWTAEQTLLTRGCSMPKKGCTAEFPREGLKLLSLHSSTWQNAFRCSPTVRQP